MGYVPKGYVSWSDTTVLLVANTNDTSDTMEFNHPIHRARETYKRSLSSDDVYDENEEAEIQNMRNIMVSLRLVEKYLQDYGFEGRLVAYRIEGAGIVDFSPAAWSNDEEYEQIKSTGFFKRSDFEELEQGRLPEPERSTTSDDKDVIRLSELPPYVRFLAQSVRNLDIPADKKCEKSIKTLVKELRDEWPHDRDPVSHRKLSLMASFLRQPSQGKAGGR